ncbi:hypothetical protein [Allorhodopirellula solitaria]|uniref:Uncharacterized protein n=1 Tax=Allorhodopirellula solitaria TaxID=2527987 RepID=A0A5C5YK50_9BACT|nr:hypothetical protein [Allorhodopirellula solitaria]TWT75286.1 hypothetical protein CA85_05760 [Allorhodopirellula solitaria]
MHDAAILADDSVSGGKLAIINRMAEEQTVASGGSTDCTIAVVEAMSVAIDHCDDIDELQRGLPAAAYLKDLLRQSSASLTKLNEAASLRLRIMRKIGLLLRELNLRGGDRRSNSHAASLKLEDLNLKKDFASRCRKIASLDDRIFSTAIEAAIESEHELTAVLFYRLAEAQKRRESGPETDDPDPPVDSANSLVSLTGVIVSPVVHAGPTPIGYRLIREEDFEELHGSAEMLSRLLGDAIIDAMLRYLEREADDRCTGVKQIPRYLRQLQDALGHVSKAEDA